MLAVLDLVGILAIGFVVTSTVIFLTAGSSPDRVLNFAGLQIPAVTAGSLPVVGIAILATFLFKSFLSILITRRTAYFVATIEARAAKVIAERVFGGDLAQARLRSREEMSYAIQFGSPAAFNSILNSTSTVIAEGVLFLLICLGLLIVDPLSTLAAVAYFALIAASIHYFVGTLMAKAGQQATHGTIQANSAVGDLVAVFRELSVLGLRHKYIDRIYQSRMSATDSAATQTYLSGMPRYIIEASLLVGVASFVLVQALSDDIVASAAAVGVFLPAGLRLTAAILPLQSALLNIKASIPSAATAYEILLEKFSAGSQVARKEEPWNGSSEILSPLALGVVFDSVSFKYSGSEQMALSDITFEILPGQQVAFIGASGAGKSTIADLICSVLVPSTGAVSVGPSRRETQLEYLNSISYVPQKPGLVSGSVAENVALGIDTENIDEVRVKEAIERAHLSAVIESLPEGIHANLGNYQDNLSGGQIQRLGLARALYSEPGLLVMDEATSALDAESELEISKALNRMRGKVTVVLIAHRLNTVQHADKVFLIDSGKVADSGTFQELVKRNPSLERVVNLMRVDPRG
jgi:ABC-type multidrug transport system fused ATPase/permease subunit